MTDEIDEDSVREYERTQEIVDGVLKWLKFNKGMLEPGNDYGTWCKTNLLQQLIEEVELCGENGEFPWELDHFRKNF